MDNALMLFGIDVILNDQADGGSGTSNMINAIVSDILGFSKVTSTLTSVMCLVSSFSVSKLNKTWKVMTIM